MKNKVLKLTYALALSSCLLFTACGAEETVASIEESTAESTVESTTDVVEESVAEVENDMESDVVESEVETPLNIGVDSVGGWDETDTGEEVIYEDEYVEPVEEETTTDTSSSSGKKSLDEILDFWKQLYDQGLMTEAEYNEMVETSKRMNAEQQQQQTQPQLQPGQYIRPDGTISTPEADAMVRPDTTAENWDPYEEVDLPDHLKGDIFNR